MLTLLAAWPRGEKRLRRRGKMRYGSDSLPIALRLAIWASAAVCVGAQIEFETRPERLTGQSSVGIVRLWPWGVDPATARVSVSNDTSAAAACSVLSWPAAGEPLDLTFDRGAGSGVCTVRIEDGPSAPASVAATTPWRPTAGLVLETRSLPDGPVDTLSQVDALWKRSRVVLGRSVVADVDLAVHPHGPNGPMLARFEGWFEVPREGRYGFATISEDASFLLIDDRLVASWPGWHALDGSGLRGEYGGEVALQRGAHRLVYLNAQNDAGLTAVAAWRPPGATRFAVMPAGAFPPMARYRCVRAAAPAGPSSAAAAFGWEIEEHAQAGTNLVVGVRFFALLPPPGAVCRWRFDDGTFEDGVDLRHAFARPGTRQVTLEILTGGTVAGRLTRPVAVRPRWTQLAEFPESVYGRLVAAARRAGWPALRPEDAAAFVLLADRVADRDLLGELAATVHSRLPEFRGPSAEALVRLGFFAQHPSVRQYGWVEDFWRAVLRGADAPEGARAKAALHLAGFLVHTGRDLGEADRLLALLPEAIGDETDARLRTIFVADAHASRGERAAAEALYLQAGTVVAANDTAYQVRRLARIENARAYLRQKEYDAAEQTVREIEWERPLERLELETGLLMLAVYRGRGEAPFALALCRRLLRAAPDDPRRSELLRAMAEVCQEQGLAEESRQTLDRLYRDHPYSEAAALARDRFGGAEAAGQRR
jgi:tetratricopeptide (TPR) repeat protein